MFEQSARGDSIVLTMKPKPTQHLQTIANKLLGQVVFVNWPHLTEALVVAVSDRKHKLNLVSEKQGEKKFFMEFVKDELERQFEYQKKSIAET